MKYENRRKVWWKPGEVTHNPQKLDPVTWKVFCEENIKIALSFGVEMSEGATMVYISYRKAEKIKVRYSERSSFRKFVGYYDYNTDSLDRDCIHIIR